MGVRTNRSFLFLLCLLCFFFQAEDGIRDLVRSRGLGDVYKRQGAVKPDLGIDWRTAVAFLFGAVASALAGILGMTTVSYTHLTLPTIYSV